MSQDFSLEIGCEELPSDYMPGALDWNYPQGGMGLASAASSIFDQNKIVWKELQSFGTLRRLVLKVSGVESLVQEEIEGPPASIAFDAQGNLTAAAKGFAKKQGVAVSKLKRKQTSRGERLVLERSIPVAQVLKNAVVQIIERIAFPKTMRWDESGVRFARPIRSLAAHYGSKVIPCRFGKIVAGDKAAAGALSAVKPLRVQLEEGQRLRRKEDGSVEVAAFRRSKSQALLRKLKAAARRLGGCLPDQTTEDFQWLLSTMTFLAEDPFVASGTFQKEYLDLPAEVLATSMAKHLKLMGVYSKGEPKLLPAFLAVLEGKPATPQEVMANMERILEARFSDARLFYREDTREPLDAKRRDLQRIVFHEKLGTVAEKELRLEQLMRQMAKDLGAGSLFQFISHTAKLAKADLVTHMVREFPSLQGTMGSYYAARDGHPPQVVRALAEIYQPRTSAEALPKSPLGALLSLADRLDTLIGFFSAGMKPTGSVDPYGLRRLAMGVVRIFLSPLEGVSFVGLSIDRVLEAGIQSWDFKRPVDRLNLKKELRAFLRERWEWWVVEQEGIDRELADSVLAAGDDDLAGAWQRLKVLVCLWNSSKDKPMVIKAAKVAERTSRMVKSAKEIELPSQVDAQLLSEPEEKRLWQVWSQTASHLKKQLEARQYEEATRTYSLLYEPVHSFFEKVFVMDENLDVRKNRLAFIKEIHESLAGRFADLSKLSLSGAA